MNNKTKLKVIELFAGVGGFRLGLESSPGKNGSKYNVIWSNQFEPMTKNQHAAEIYRAKWNSNSHLDVRDINEIIEKDIKSIPDHDVLTGGFPCQDYSVAKPLRQAAGIQGRKGILWWCIYEILRQKKKKPKYLILENVDRLLKSPANQRGRDFAIMLSSLAEQGYAVEWRVINASDYGFPQRRRRVFILGYHKSTTIYKKIQKVGGLNWLAKNGVMAKAFPVKCEFIATALHKLDKDPVKISKDFGNDRKEKSPFAGSGIMLDYEYITLNLETKYTGAKKSLSDILQSPDEVDASFYINGSMEKWKYLKGAKSAPRKSKDGHCYFYSEGSMSFPDPLDRPARTIVTGEGGATASRFKHVIKDAKGLRRLTPVELERLNGFPDNHTKLKGVTDIKRAFLMGNALVVGVVRKIGEQLAKEI